jgi:hypothetical protein
VGKKIPDKISAASRNDTAPILGVLLEPISLKRIDLVADDAGYRHWFPFRLVGTSQPADSAASAAMMPPMASGGLIGLAENSVGCIGGSVPVVGN